MPKIFIIHASAGFGHKMAAEAIYGVAVDSYGANNVKLIYILDHVPASFKFAYSKGYIFCISKLTWLWSLLFFLSNTKFLKLLNFNFRRFANRLVCTKFLEYVKKENPDVVISTHFLVTELISLLKGRNQIKSKLITVVTDFGVHNFWIAENVNIYTAACNRTKQILLSNKIDADKIRVLGIPIRKQFQRPLDQKAIRSKLGIKSDAFTVFILSGGIGIGPIYEIVKMLNDSINVVVVCGNNNRLSDQLKQLNYRNLVILGWIDYVEEVMSVSDIVITKPGGSTISESLMMDLPMIFFSIIPGQEQQNSKIISEAGLGFVLKNPHDIKEKVLYFKEHKDEIDLIRNKIREFKTTDSARKIIELAND